MEMQKDCHLPKVQRDLAFNGWQTATYLLTSWQQLRHFFFGKIDHSRNETFWLKKFFTLLTPQFTPKIVKEWKSTNIYWWI